MKKSGSSKYRGDKLGRLRMTELFAGLVLVFIIVFGFIIGISRISGNSMYPTAQSGHPAVYLRLAKSFSRGDIVVVRMPSGEYLLKRVIAVAGDTVDIVDGTVYINGAAEEGTYVTGSTEAGEGSGTVTQTYPLTVGEGQVFLLGDNREVSQDSRHIGTVAVSQIRGRVIWLP